MADEGGALLREAQLTAFYSAREPSKLENVPLLLEKFTPAQIAASLWRKYGALPEGWEQWDGGREAGEGGARGTAEGGRGAGRGATESGASAAPPAAGAASPLPPRAGAGQGGGAGKVSAALLERARLERAEQQAKQATREAEADMGGGAGGAAAAAAKKDKRAARKGSKSVRKSTSSKNGGVNYRNKSFVPNAGKEAEVAETARDEENAAVREEDLKRRKARQRGATRSRDHRR
jgi:hypothetical protein